MKKFLFLFLCVGFVPFALQAATLRPYSQANLRLIANHPRVLPMFSPSTSRLRQSAQQAFEHALKAQKSLPPDRRLLLGNPAFAIKSPLPPRESLPALPEEIRSRQDITDYYLQHLNEQYIHETTFMRQNVFPQLEKRLLYLQRQAFHFKQPHDPLAFIVNQIPARVNTLVISLFHSENFTAELNYLWQQLRLQRPNQKMILLTEALPRDFEWLAVSPYFSEDGLHYPHRPVLYDLQESYGPTLDEAARQQIRVIGLEAPEVIEQDFQIFTLTPEGTEEQTDFWASLEGVQRRNREWAEKRKEILQEEPDAPLIIYLVGGLHGFYNKQHSLTQGLDPQKTFVLALYPSSYQRQLFHTEDDSVLYVTEHVQDPLETLTNGTFLLPQNVLYFPDKEDAQAIGFDAWYRKESPTDF